MRNPMLTHSVPITVYTVTSNIIYQVYQIAVCNYKTIKTKPISLCRISNAENIFIYALILYRSFIVATIVERFTVVIKII